jgi:putative exosortase-associated protein (TIGR04073 family)
MKTLLAAAFALVLAASSFADIQDPPGNEYGPTRKLGRGFSNLLLGQSEVFVTVGKVNTDEGNMASFVGYGMVRGVGRSWMRHLAGLVEVLTAPFPINHGTYYPILPSDIPYIHAGFAEFPPELGNESKYPYVRQY